MTYNFSPTVSGTAISSTNKVADATSLMIERSNGMFLYPWTATGTQQFTAATCRWVRFVPARNLTILRFGFEVRTASTNAESVDIGIYDATGTRLVSSGATTTYYTTTTGTTTTTTTAAGYKYVVLNSTTGYTLTAGTTYYAGIGFTFTSGTGVTIATIPMYGATLMGTTVGVVDAANQTAVSTLPATMASATVGGTVAPMLGLIT